MKRSQFARTTVSAWLAVGTLAPAPSEAIAASTALAELERRSGGRLGVAVDDGERTLLAHREHERFPMCSTFKALAVAAVLARVDRGAEHLEREIRYGRGDLLDYAPVTSAHVASGAMRVGDLCAAAIELSDNTAANLLLASLGGPPAVTAFARSLSDTITRLDRNEPALNTAIPGDVRDTTTPAATARDLYALVHGSRLSPSSRARFSAWLGACRTGDARLRAGLPKAWRVGDKTGSGANGTTNDIATCAPPGRAPLTIATYLTGSHLASSARERVLADVGAIVARTLAAN